MKLFSPKQSRRFLKGCYLITAAALASLSNSQAASPSELDSFAKNIEAAFTHRCTGFGYAIYDNGNYVRGGGAGFRYKSDHPISQLPFDENTQKDCHSMSKTITAAAMIKALQIKNIGLDAKIYDYFPKKFQNKTPDDAIKLITFQHILSHRSGFADSAKTWSQLLDELKDGLDFDVDSKRDYSNWNYGMCRLLIPYVLYHDALRNAETKVLSSQLNAACADLYINFTRNWILKPSGAHATRTRAPKDPKSVNFAYLYNWYDHDAEGIMPDRRLNIGSGGWAMSAKEYGKFLRKLFNEELLDPTVKVGNGSVNTVEYMQENNLGMMKIWGSGGERYYWHNGANGYSNKSGNYGGQSAWMHYPSKNLCAVVQINCGANAITAAGIPRTVHLQETYDEAMTSPSPSELAHPMNLFCSRKQDGLIMGRGVFDNGLLGPKNFDQKTEINWTLTRFFETPQQTFMLRYNPDNGQNHGTLQVQKVKADGTLGSITYTGESWSKNWSHLEIFHKNNGTETYLLCYRKSDGKFRTYLVENDGVVVGPAITDEVASPDFDVVKVVRLNGSDHLFRHNSTSGHTHVRKLDEDGTWGPTVYDKNWKSGFPSFNFYTTDTGDTFILRYNWSSGKANILKFDSTIAGLDETSSILDSQWSLNWRTIRFFKTDDGTFSLRYNPANGWIRVQKIRSNGTFGEVSFSSDNAWLRPRSADGAFVPATSGWDTLEPYFAKDVVNQPSPPRATVAPPRAETGSNDSSRDTAPLGFPRPIPLTPATPKTTFIRGDIQMNWVGQNDVLYFIEKSPDLVNWQPTDLLGGDGEPIRWSRELQEEDPANPGQLLPRCFFRIRTIEGAPDEE